MLFLASFGKKYVLLSGEISFHVFFEGKVSVRITVHFVKVTFVRAFDGQKTTESVLKYKRNIVFVVFFIQEFKYLDNSDKEKSESKFLVLLSNIRKQSNIEF